jgi:uncharacterized protein involved in exopolysaccharide biosynthesis
LPNKKGKGNEARFQSFDLDTQVKVLQSDALAMQVVRELKLDQNRNFIRACRFGPD